MSKKIFNLMKIILGTGLLLVLYYKIGFVNIINEIGRMNLLFIPLILFVLFLIFLIGTANIGLFVRALKYRIPLRKLLKFYLISWASGLLVPGKLGEFALVPLLKNEGVNLGESLSIALLDKLITAFTLGIISIIGLLLIFQLPKTSLIMIIIISGICLPLLLISSDSIRKFIRKRLLGRYEKRFKGLYKTFFSLLKSKVTAFNIVLTLIKWVFSAISLWAFFLSLGTNVQIIQIFFINSIATIISLVPITISGLGIREATAIYLYSIVNVQATIVASVYLLFITLNYLTGILIFLFIGFEKKDLRL